MKNKLIMFLQAVFDIETQQYKERIELNKGIYLGNGERVRRARKQIS